MNQKVNPLTEAAGENIAETLTRELQRPSVFNFPPAPNVVHMTLPNGMSSHEIDLEKYLPAPSRKKGSAKFTDGDSFLRYVAEHKIAGSTAWCTFDPQTFALSFRAVINDHAAPEAGWRDHIATFTPDMSAEWKTWKSKDATPFAQVAFAEWIEAHAEDIASRDGLPTDLQMLAMATNFVAHEDHVLKSSVRLQSGGVRLNYVADADAGTVESMDLFKQFAIGIPVFQGGKPWEIQARLKYRTNSGKVSFLYELIRADRVHENAARSLIDQVRAGLADVPLLMGSF